MLGGTQDGPKITILGAWEQGRQKEVQNCDPQSLTPGEELSVFLLTAAAKGTIIRRWHFALKLSPSASDIFLFLLVRRPFSATDSNDSDVRISSLLGEKPSVVTLGWMYALAKVKKAGELVSTARTTGCV